jgi:hypothetical protein
MTDKAKAKPAKPKAAPTSVVVQVRMPIALKDALVDFASRQPYQPTQAAVMVEALKAYLKIHDVPRDEPKPWSA